MTTLVIKNKEVRGKRLYRSLRTKFNRRDFGFEWTDFQTAYFDGKTIFVAYKVNKPDRQFTTAETHILHLGFGYHEMGHKLYDNVQDFLDWAKESSSTDVLDWQANDKWPADIVRTWGNLAMDGRLERFLRIDYPFATDEIDFLNYEWAYTPSDETKRGVSKVDDLMEMFGRRCLEMTDLEGWHEEVVELLNLHQPLLDAAFVQSTTIDCIAKSKEHLAAIWPTFYQWMQDENRAPDTTTPNNSKDRPFDESNWTPDMEELKNNIKRAMDKLQESANASNSPSKPSESGNGKQEADKEDNGKEGDNEPSQPQQRPQPDFKRLVSRAENEMKQSEKEAAEEFEESQAIQMPVQATYNNAVINDKVIIDNVPKKDEYDGEAAFEQMVSSKKRQIVSLQKALTTILAPVPDEVSYNQRRGRISPGRVWRATQCDDLNIRTKRMAGLPSKDASISLMLDASGSTGSMISPTQTVMGEMKEALAIFLSAAHNIKLASKAYAFTTDYDKGTTVYRLKTNDTEFKSRNKEAIGNLRPYMGNRDVIALQYLLSEVEKRDESIRLAFMISDGAPNFTVGESESSIAEMVKTSVSKGIDVFCLFVGNDDNGYACAKRMYGNRVIRSTAGLANDLKKQLLKILSIRRGI